MFSIQNEMEKFGLLMLKLIIWIGIISFTFLTFLDIVSGTRQLVKYIVGNKYNIIIHVESGA